MSNSTEPMRTTIQDVVAQWARQAPDTPYYISAEDGQTLTYGQLDQYCRTIGEQCLALGYKPGDKVSVYMPNCQAAAVILLGVMANGLVANPINLLAQTSQLRHILWHSDTRVVFTTQDHAATLATTIQDVDRPIDVVVVDPAEKGVPEFSAAHVSESSGAAPRPNGQMPEGAQLRPASDWPALLMYTSGTTGVPKGVVLTHDNLISCAVTITQEHRLTSQDRVLGSLPLYHINGLVVTLLTPLIHGGSVVMTSRFSVATFWQDASRYACTWINVVPTIIAYLLHDKTGKGDNDTGRIRFCRSASSALSPEHLKAFEERFGLGIIETMGLTETAAPAFSNPYDTAQRRIGSIGRPSGTQAKIVDAAGDELQNYEHGEIVLTGRNVMREYYKDPERTQEAFTPDGWLKTGDIGYRDDDGFFYIIGRAKELIIKGGENIAPREIDEVVVKHPCVLDAAAVGIPHPDYGQDIAVYLVLRPDAVFDDADMHRHCLVELGRYKTPSKFVVVDELPRGPSGKVQRLKLAEL